MIKAEDAKEYFEAYRTVANGYMVTCCNPWHKDSNPSVHISDSYRKDGQHRLLVKCFAGCDPRTILDHINACSSGRFSPSMIEKLASGKSIKAKKLKEETLKVVAKYTYEDRYGKLQYQVFRFIIEETGKKTFRYRRPATPEEKNHVGGYWVWKKDGFSPILYNLPAIYKLKESNPSQYIFKVEGEGKVDRLKSMGLVGTCNTFGGTTGKFLPEYAEDLRNCNICFLPDNDLTGYNHLYEVFSVLEPVVNSFKVVQLPVKKEKDDIIDWLDKYLGTKDDLLSFLEKAEELKGKSIEYVMNNYKFLDSSFEEVFPEDSVETENPIYNQDKDLYPEYNDLDDIPSNLVPVKETITTEVMGTAVLGITNLGITSPLLTQFLEEGKNLFNQEGIRAGLCETCFGYGYLLGMNDDGFPSVVVDRMTDHDTEKEQVQLKKCFHGQYAENVNDFNF